MLGQVNGMWEQAVGASASVLWVAGLAWAAPELAVAALVS